MFSEIMGGHFSLNEEDIRLNAVNSRLGGSPGLDVMGGDSCSKGCWFKSQCRILEDIFSDIFIVRIVMFV